MQNGPGPQAAPPRPPPPPPPGKKRGLPPPKPPPARPAAADKAAGAATVLAASTGPATSAPSPGRDHAPLVVAPARAPPRFRTLHWTKAVAQVCPDTTNSLQDQQQ